ncbi:MAG: tripartite tricarboxylate transporter substrate binding protein [Clostridiaceae bacterium]|jgi:tripartite-type tricarboxylate transporter receptor subunit TctC|nr:tripartite tricarboxylate transporter substrate binding protein [Clostridiaceae bacterium]
MSKKNVKSIAILLVVAMLSFGLIGCSNSGSTEPATSEPAGSASGNRPEGVPEDFPNKEIEWIYAFGPGSPIDAYMRILSDKIQKTEGWKHGIIVTYKEGASGRIGWNAWAEAKPDGYTIGFAPSAMLISAVSEEVSYGADKMSYIFNTMSDPGAIGVAANSKYKSLQDIVEDAKARPGKVTFGVTSTIGQEGLTLKLIEKAAGVDFNIVAFDGEGPVFAAVIGGHVDAFCLNITDATTFIEDKQVVILATGDDERSPFLPDVPTYKEAGYDVKQLNMRGIGAPKGVPEPIRQYLEDCFIAAANDPEVKAKVAEMKIPVDTLTGAELEQAFTSIQANYKKLWEEEPWE